MKELLDVALDAVKLVATALVVVELPTMRSVIDARVATREEMKELVVVALVEILLVEKKSVAVSAVAEAVASDVCPDAVSAVTVVVARVEVPVVVSVPPMFVSPETVRAVVDAVPNVADAAYKFVDVELVDEAFVVIIVEKVPVVNVGLAEREIVLVPEKMMFDEATRLERGLL